VGVRRLLVHLDIDAFLASVAQICEPALLGRPVAVGSGVVASRSYEAKARGVETAMGMGEAFARCPELVRRDGDARLAARFRERTAAVFARFAPKVEVSALDDMYGELHGWRPESAGLGGLEIGEAIHAFGRRIQAAVRAETGLSVSLGFGATRTLARLATERAKPGGVFWVRPGEERAFLAGLPVASLPGVGRRTRLELAQYGITTIGGLRAVELDTLRAAYGARGEELYWKARGRVASERDRGLDVPVGKPGGVWIDGGAQVSRSTSFDEPVGERGFLEGMLAYLADRAAATLRARGRRAGRLDLWIDLPSGSRRQARPRGLPDRLERGCRLDPPEASGRRIAERACALLDELLAARCLVQRLGLVLTRLTPAPEHRQRSLAELLPEAPRALRLERLEASLDRLRRRHGFGAVVAGAATGLLGRVPQGREGFRLRTPSLTL